jgi:hemerythrin-like domain-containing protein
MSRPTHLLKHEHRVIEQAMRGLEGICFRMKTGVAVPGEDLGKALNFVHHYIDGFHHMKEETLLFPALKQLGFGREGGPLDFLQMEHDRERQLMKELEQAINADRHQSSSEKFVTAAQQFKDHLINHMQREETMLFPLLEELLDDPLKDSLLLEMSLENRESIEMIMRYENLAGELERKWSV